jgi:hypothetical protein
MKGRYRIHRVRIGAFGLAVTFLACLTPRATAQNPFTNLDFSQGGQMPTGWELSADSARTYRFARDTQVFLKGPASLRITNDGPAAQGIVKMIGTSVPRQAFVFSGYVKATGQWNLIAAVVATFTDQWQRIDWEKNQVNVTPSETWTHFSKEVTLAPNTRHLIFNLQVSGVGTVWFADLQITTRSMTLRPAVEGQLLYRFTSPRDTSWPLIPLPEPSSDGLISLPVPPGLSTEHAQLEVHDTGRNLLAILPVDLTQTVPLTPERFRYVASVKIPVQRGGKPVMGVTVRLASPSVSRPFHQEHTLTAKDNGVARFRNIPLHEPLVLNVLSGSHEPKMETRTLTGANAPDGYDWPAISVDWPDVRTVTAEEVAAAQRNAAPVAPAPGSNGASSTIIPLAMALGACGALILALSWLLVRQRTPQPVHPQTRSLTTLDVPVAALPNADTPSLRPKEEVLAVAPHNGSPQGGNATAFDFGEEQRRLVGLTGLYAGQNFALSGPTSGIGRDLDNTVALTQDTSVSRHHATIHVTSGQYSVADHGSASGTFLNGVRLAVGTPQPLRSGDELEIGKTRFRFEVSAPVGAGG